MNVFLPVVSIASQRYVPTLDLRSGERDFAAVRYGVPDGTDDVNDRVALETLVNTHPDLQVEAICGFENGTLSEHYAQLKRISRDLAFEEAKERVAQGLSVKRSKLEKRSRRDAIEELLCTALHALHPPYEERGSVWSVHITNRSKRASIIHEEDAQYVKDSFIAFETVYAIGRRILAERSDRVRVSRYPLAPVPSFSVPRYFG